MHRHFEEIFASAALLTLGHTLGCSTSDCKDCLDGGEDAVQTLPMPRVPSFSVGGQRGSVAVLGRGRQVYAVSTPAEGLDPNSPATPASACLEHSVQRFLPPMGSSKAIVAEGLGPTVTVEVKTTDPPYRVTGARNRSTVLWDLGNVADKTALEFPAPLAGAAMSGDRLFAFTAFAQGDALWCHEGFLQQGVSAACVGAEPDATKERWPQATLLADVGRDRTSTSTLNYEVAAVFATANGNYLVESRAGNLLKQLRENGSIDDSCEMQVGECGITVAADGACALHSLTSGDAASERASLAGCGSSWTRVVVSSDGCAAAIVQKDTGQGLVISLPGAGCALPDREYSVAAPPLTEPTGSDFRIALSSNGLWAAIYPAGTSAVPVRLISMLNGSVTATEIARPQSVEFACDDATGNCTLWALHDGSYSDPMVTAVSTTDGMSIGKPCPSALPIASLHVVSSKRATFIGADSFNEHELTRIDLEQSLCKPVPLPFLPVCHGSSGEDRTFVCAPDRDGDVELISWTEPPTVSHIPQFSLENRSSGGDCQ